MCIDSHEMASLFFFFFSEKEIECHVAITRALMLQGTTGGMVQWRVFILRNLNRRHVRWLILLCVIFIVFETCRRRPYYPRKPTDFQATDRFITVHGFHNASNSKRKNILLWTPMFRSWRWHSDVQIGLNGCSHKCYVSRNRAELNTSDAILFHADDFWEYRQSFWATFYNPVIPLPSRRHPDQVWVLWSQEPLCHMYGVFPPHIFNWTAHYRRDSTIFTPYDMYLEKPDIKTNTNVTKPEVLVPSHFREKTKMAVIVTSNCRVQSRRYRIVKELSKHIDVHEMGSCSDHVVCPKRKGFYECDKYIDKYKFYLAFENSYCRDYFTEKFWRSLERNQIPVVAASDNSLELLPNNSYLNVFDFTTIKDLAKRMLEIANNESLYNTFFQWRKRYRKDNENAFCKLCRGLHENKRHQSYHDLEGWFTEDSCYQPNVSMYKSKT